jgi:hypothetical protein
MIMKYYCGSCGKEIDKNSIACSQEHLKEIGDFSLSPGLGMMTYGSRSHGITLGCGHVVPENNEQRYHLKNRRII